MYCCSDVLLYGVNTAVLLQYYCTVLLYMLQYYCTVLMHCCTTVSLYCIDVLLHWYTAAWGGGCPCERCRTAALHCPAVVLLTVPLYRWLSLPYCCIVKLCPVDCTAVPLANAAILLYCHDGVLSTCCTAVLLTYSTVHGLCLCTAVFLYRCTAELST